MATLPSRFLTDVAVAHSMSAHKLVGQRPDLEWSVTKMMMMMITMMMMMTMIGDQ
jgi:hypothetical protein